jgi:hypothetical protein
VLTQGFDGANAQKREIRALLLFRSLQRQQADSGRRRPGVGITCSAACTPNSLDILRDELPDDDGKVSVKVKDESERHIFKATNSLVAEWLD